MQKKTAQQKLALLKKNFFISPFGTSVEECLSQLEVSLRSVLDHAGDGPIYEENVGIPSISDLISESVIPANFSPDPKKILRKLHQYVQGTVKAGHPYMVKNIIPSVSTPALASYVASSIFMGNGVTGEDSAQTLLAEISCSSQIAKLVGWNPDLSGGLFTFGGTATNLYAIKIGLSKVDPEHNRKGITQPVVCIESVPSHYCHTTATDWLGIGTDHLIKVVSNPDQTTNMKALESACYKALKEKKKIACINALAGTTSNMGIDDMKKIYDLRNKLVEEFKLDYVPHIHADAVLGWSYLVFTKYDFATNPLDFSVSTLKKIKKIVRRISTLKYVDSFGIDFHKTGYVAYNSSMVMVKNRDDFKLLRREGDVMTPLFHENTAYNPGKYSLETSRSAANMLATWVALQTFGLEGYQLLLGHALEMGRIYREEVNAKNSEGLYVANQESFGPDVFVRCYPPTTLAAKTFMLEMNDNDVLAINTKYTTQFANWLEAKGYPHREDGFAISRSSAAIYTYTGLPMVALRIYPLSPYIERKHAKELIKRLAAAKKLFDKEIEASDA